MKMKTMKEILKPQYIKILIKDKTKKSRKNKGDRM